MSKLDVTPVVGLPQFTGWSQVVSKSVSTGELICAFAVDGEHAGNIGRDVMELFDDLTAESASELLTLITKLTSLTTELDATLHVVCGLFISNKMILGAQFGSIFLKRESRTGILLTAYDQPKIIEGEIKVDDVVVLSTLQSSTFFEEVELKFSTGYDLDSVITSIVPGIHGLDDSSLSSMAFIHLPSAQTISTTSTPHQQKQTERFEESREETIPTVELDQPIKKEQLNEEQPEHAAQPLKSLESAQMTETVAPPLDIPPSLRLRGAGKGRNTREVTSKVIEKEEQEGKEKQEGKGGREEKGKQEGKGGRKEKEPKAREPKGRDFYKQTPTPLGPGLEGLGQGDPQVATRSTNSILATLGKGSAKIGNGLVVLVKKIANSIKTAISRLPNLASWIGTKLKSIPALFSQRQVYLQVPSRRKILRVVVPIMIGVFLIGGLIVFQLVRTRQSARAIEETLDPYRQQLNAAQEQVAADPIPAREKVSEVIARLEQLETEYQGQRTAEKRIAAQLAAARQLYSDISGREEFSQLEIFYDLRLAEPDFVATQVSAYQDQAVFLDQERKQAVVLDITNKQHHQFSFEQLDSVKDIELQADQLFVLNNGIHRQSSQLGSLLEEAVPEGDSNRDATFIEAFSSYVYVLNPNKRDIYRYIEQEDGYSDPIGWVSGAAQFDYEQVTSWAIDGDIWIGTREGELHKLSSGQEVEFEIVGLEESIEGSVVVFTNDELENLYLLESDKHRLLILNKDGEFLREITSESLASATSLFVSESQNKAFAISGSIIYAIDL